jgi:hypothetical protein
MKKVWIAVIHWYDDTKTRDGVGVDIYPDRVYDTKESALRAARSMIREDEDIVIEEYPNNFDTMGPQQLQDFIFTKTRDQCGVHVRELDIWTWDERGTRTLELNSMDWGLARAATVLTETASDIAADLSKGWCLSERSDGFYEIQKNDYQDVFDSDFAAHIHVRALADKGDEQAIQALRYHGTKVTPL